MFCRFWISGRGGGLCRPAHTPDLSLQLQPSAPTSNLPTKIIPTKIAWLKILRKSPMDIRIPPRKFKIMLESTPLRSRILVQYGDWPHRPVRSSSMLSQPALAWASPSVSPGRPRSFIFCCFFFLVCCLLFWIIMFFLKMLFFTRLSSILSTSAER